MQTGINVKHPDGKEEIIHIPYNLENRYITEMDVIKLLARYNINIDKINHMEYIMQAFNHKSYCKKQIFTPEILSACRIEMGEPEDLIELQDNSYERLEYLGDRVLKLIVSFYIFNRYPTQDEGFMSRLQTKIEDKKNLSIMSKEMGLGKFFIISRQIENMNGRNIDKIHEDVFESFMGALFLSNGFEVCMYLIVNLLETEIDYSEKLYCDNNYKDQLIRLYHQYKWSFPQYVNIYYEGPPHKRKYIVGIIKNNTTKDTCIKDRYISFGFAPSKKEAEQLSAKMALIQLGVLKEDQYTKSDIFYPDWDKIGKYENGKYIVINKDEVIENNYVSDDEGDMSDKSVVED